MTWTKKQNDEGIRQTLMAYREGCDQLSISDQEDLLLYVRRLVAASQAVWEYAVPGCGQESGYDDALQAILCEWASTATKTRPCPYGTTEPTEFGWYYALVDGVVTIVEGPDEHGDWVKLGWDAPISVRPRPEPRPQGGILFGPRVPPPPE